MTLAVTEPENELSAKEKMREYQNRYQLKYKEKLRSYNRVYEHRAHRKKYKEHYSATHQTKRREPLETSKNLRDTSKEPSETHNNKLHASSQEEPPEPRDGKLHPTSREPPETREKPSNGDYWRTYRLLNKERLREYQRNYVLVNRGKKREYHKHYLLENKERRRDYHRLYRLREKRREYIREYSLARKEKRREGERIRSQKRGTPFPYWFSSLSPSLRFLFLLVLLFCPPFVSLTDFSLFPPLAYFYRTKNQTHQEYCSRKDFLEISGRGPKFFRFRGRKVTREFSGGLVPRKRFSDPNIGR
jgi:hypothetical protein